ncbi:hypothetical protein [Microbaculum sp. FT89]|uniref:hypothetical protein n=1 Tax=Microbaculum sp. FT89 TaxID=3447298 RepID=UPI003F5313BD
MLTFKLVTGMVVGYAIVSFVLLFIVTVRQKKRYRPRQQAAIVPAVARYSVLDEVFSGAARPPSENEIKQEKARSLLAQSREELADWYIEQTTVHGVPDHEAHHAFIEQWRKVCNLVKAKYGDMICQTALYQLRLDDRQ